MISDQLDRVAALAYFVAFCTLLCIIISAAWRHAHRLHDIPITSLNKALSFMLLYLSLILLIYHLAAQADCLDLHYNNLCLSPLPIPLVRSRHREIAIITVIPTRESLPFEAPQSCNYNFSSISQQTLDLVGSYTSLTDQELLLSSAPINSQRHHLWTHIPFIHALDIEKELAGGEKELALAQAAKGFTTMRPLFQVMKQELEMLVRRLRYLSQITTRETKYVSRFNTINNNTLDLAFQSKKWILSQRHDLHRLAIASDNLNTELSRVYFNPSALPLSERLRDWRFQAALGQHRLLLHDKFLKIWGQTIKDRVINATSRVDLLENITSTIIESEQALFDMYATEVPIYHTVPFLDDEDSEGDDVPWHRLTNRTQVKIKNCYDLRFPPKPRPAENVPEGHPLEPRKSIIMSLYQTLDARIRSFLGHHRFPDPTTSTPPSVADSASKDSPNSWQAMFQRWLHTGWEFERPPVISLIAEEEIKDEDKHEYQHAIWTQPTLSRFVTLEEARQSSRSQVRAWTALQARVDALRADVKALYQRNCFGIVFHYNGSSSLDDSAEARGGSMDSQVTRTDESLMDRAVIEEDLMWEMGILHKLVSIFSGMEQRLDPAGRHVEESKGEEAG